MPIAFAVSICGIGGAFPDGHYASTSVIGTAAYNRFRWKTLFPVEVYVDHPPASSMYYMHHPLGMFWVVDVLGKLFGLHDWVLRLPPLVYVTATTLLLFKIGRALWGALPGGLTALAYVALPITLGYANYHDLEQPVIFGVVLASWGYLRFVRTWRERYALASVLGFVFALNNDWAAYLWGAPFLAGLFVYAFVLSEPTRGPLQMKPFGRYWALMCVGVALSFAVELVVLSQSGRISGRAVVLSAALIRNGHSAQGGAGVAPLPHRADVHHARDWPGKAGPPRHRRARRCSSGITSSCWRSPSFLRAGPVPGLQGGGRRSYLLAALLRPLLRAGDRRAGGLGLRADGVGLGAPRPGRARRGASGRAVGGVVLLGLPVGFVLKDGLSLVRLARETGGRFAEANMDTDLDKEAVLRWFLARYPPTVGIAYHGAIHDGWALQWELRPRLSAASQPVVAAAAESTRVYIMDTRARRSAS